MRMAIELSYDGLLETIYNVDKIEQPRLGAFAIVRRNVPYDVHLVLVQFGLEQFVDEPLELVGRIHGIIETPGIEAGAIVCIQCYYPESLAYQQPVVAATVSVVVESRIGWSELRAQQQKSSSRLD